MSCIISVFGSITIESGFINMLQYEILQMFIFTVKFIEPITKKLTGYFKNRVLEHCSRPVVFETKIKQFEVLPIFITRNLVEGYVYLYVGM